MSEEVSNVGRNIRWQKDRFVGRHMSEDGFDIGRFDWSIQSYSFQMSSRFLWIVYQISVLMHAKVFVHQTTPVISDAIP